MRISLNWLKEFVELDPRLSVQEIAWKLTEATAAIDKIYDFGKDLSSVVVGEITDIQKHPKADHLHIAKVRISPQESLTVIFGEKAHVQVGDKIPTAIAPCHLPQGKVEARTIRGVPSEGMLCLNSELMEGEADLLTKFPAKTKVGTPVGSIFGWDDRVFEIDNHALTHRSDLFSHHGFARECVALQLATWKKQAKKKNVKTGKSKLPIAPLFQNTGISKNYFSTVITGLSNKASPTWMQSKLRLCGIRPINAIVDITNYLLLEYGQPGHAFDLRLLKGKSFLHRLSKEGEEITTLDGANRKLPKEVIVVECGGAIVDLCGIMGAKNSEITPDTTEIYLHVCHYDAVLIRRAMIQLGHRTDAGTVFEKNIEAKRAEIGFYRALELFQEVFPECAFSYEIFHQEQERPPEKTVSVAFEKIASHIGIEIPQKRAVKILEDLGFSVTMKKNILSVKVPAFRSAGVNIPEDLIEEIIRIYGYSKVPAQTPKVLLLPPTKHHKRQLRRVLESVLINQGFLEESNFAFLSESLLKKIGITDGAHLLHIRNPVSDDFSAMRPNLLPYLLKNLSRNQIAENTLWKSFEVGTMFTRTEDEVREESFFTAVVATPEAEKSFFEAKGFAEILFRELALPLRMEPIHHDSAMPNRCVSLFSSDQAIGCLYELHPWVMENFDLKNSVSVIEIPIKNFELPRPKDIFYQEINRHPKAFLDVSVMVDEEVPMSDIENIIHQSSPDLLQSLKLREVYRGQPLPEKKKSFTFSLVLQHSSRTLEEKEIQNILEKIIKNLEASGAHIRR